MAKLKWKSVISLKSAITLTVFLCPIVFIYVINENFSSSIQIQRDVLKFKRNVTRIQRESKVTIKESKTKSPDMNYNAMSRKIYITNSSSFIRKTNETKVQKLQDNSSRFIVKNSTGKGSMISESKEFPGMPDPCMKPRRKTKVEDILCLKRPDFLPEYKNPCWLENYQFYCLPYFHLIGFPKCGTTDLFKRLLLHPDIVPNFGRFGKETWYWSWSRFSSISAKKSGWKLKRGMTIMEFTRQFDAKRIRTEVDSQGHHTKITGHGDPMDSYDRFSEGATPQNTPGAEEFLWTTPYSVHHVNPNIKLLLMIRDPVERLYSHYFFKKPESSVQQFHKQVVQSLKLWKNCVEGHSLRHCIYSPQLKKSLTVPIYVSVYIVHLKEWLKVFPREQLLIFRNEDYSVNIKGTMKQIFKFLDVPIPDRTVLNKMESLPNFFVTKSKKKAGPMLNETKAMLVNFYRSYTEELATFLKDERYSYKDGSFKT